MNLGIEIAIDSATDRIFLPHKSLETNQQDIKNKKGSEDIHVSSSPDSLKKGIVDEEIKYHDKVRSGNHREV